MSDGVRLAVLFAFFMPIALGLIWLGQRLRWMRLTNGNVLYGAMTLLAASELIADVHLLFIYPVGTSTFHAGARRCQSR